MDKDRYYVVFVPQYDTVSEWGGRRLIAKRGAKDEFTKAEAQEIVRFLKKRGDKAIQIKKVR